MKENKKSWIRPAVKRFGGEDNTLKMASSTDDNQTECPTSYPIVGPLCGESVIRYGTSCLLRTGSECSLRQGQDCQPTRYGPSCWQRNVEDCIPRLGADCFPRLGQPCYGKQSVGSFCKNN